MRSTFALMAMMAVYAQAVALTDDDNDLGANATAESEEIQAAVDAIESRVDDTAATIDAEAAEAGVEVESAAVNEAESDLEKLAISASIDGAFDKAEALSAGATPSEPVVEPDNYRPPPEQNHKRRERRERPNIHDHGLLRSMDLGYVNGSWQEKPKVGAIGFLSDGGGGFVSAGRT